MTTNTDQRAAWLKASSRLTEAANIFAQRNDLIARIEPRDGDSPAPAWFTPRFASIDIDPEKIGLDLADPSQISLSTRRERRRFATLTGVLSHEAAHAAHTVLEFPKGCTQDEVHWATMLEEPRIEYRALTDTNPSVRPFLRASARHVVLKGIEEFRDDSGTVLTPGLVGSMVLILGRNIGTVLKDSDVKSLREHAQERLGNKYDPIMDVITRAVHLGDNRVDELLALARELAALVEEATPEEEKEAVEKMMDKMAAGMGGDGTPGESNEAEGQSQPGNGTGRAVRMPCGAISHDDGQDDGQDDGPGSSNAGAGNSDKKDDDADGKGGNRNEPDDVLNAVNEAFDSAEEGSLYDLSQEARSGAVPPPSQDHRKKVEQRQAARQAADRIFGNRGENASGGIGAGAPHHSRVRYMKPDAQSINQSRRLTVALRRAQFREVSRTTVRSQTPPGRMNMRELTRRESQVATNSEITAAPWSRMRRRINETPPVYIGISVDASGSMDAYQYPASALAWAVAQATRHLPGRVASVAWDASASALAQPGRVNNDIPVAKAGGSSWGCPESLLALQGALNLYSDTEGIKIVIVVTDGVLPNAQEIQESVALLRRQGVHTIWVTVTGENDTRAFVPQAAAIHVALNSAAEYGDKVGNALCRLAMQIGRKVA